MRTTRSPLHRTWPPRPSPQSQAWGYCLQPRCEMWGAVEVIRNLCGLSGGWGGETMTTECILNATWVGKWNAELKIMGRVVPDSRRVSPPKSPAWLLGESGLWARARQLPRQPYTYPITATATAKWKKGDEYGNDVHYLYDWTKHNSSLLNKSWVSSLPRSYVQRLVDNSQRVVLMSFLNLSMNQGRIWKNMYTIRSP